MAVDMPLVPGTLVPCDPHAAAQHRLVEFLRQHSSAIVAYSDAGIDIVSLARLRVQTRVSIHGARRLEQFRARLARLDPDALTRSVSRSLINAG